MEESGIIKPTARMTAAAPVVARNAASPRFAKLGDRFIAFVLDIVVLFGVFASVDAWIFMRWGTVEGTELSLTTASLLMVAALNTMILFAYGWLLEASFGATLGKALVGIRVVRTGQRGAIAASAVRNLLRIVDGFGFYLVGAMVASCSSYGQRLGDHCAGTAVVEEDFSAAMKMLDPCVVDRGAVRRSLGGSSHLFGEQCGTASSVLESGPGSSRQNGRLGLFQNGTAQDRRSAGFQDFVIGRHVRDRFPCQFMGTSPLSEEIGGRLRRPVRYIPEE